MDDFFGILLIVLFLLLSAVSIINLFVNGMDASIQIEAAHVEEATGKCGTNDGVEFIYYYGDRNKMVKFADIYCVNGARFTHSFK